MMKQLIVFSSARNLHRNVQEGQGNQITVSHIPILCLYQLYYFVYNDGRSHLIWWALSSFSCSPHSLVSFLEVEFLYVVWILSFLLMIYVFHIHVSCQKFSMISKPLLIICLSLRSQIIPAWVDITH